jgi:hypothetical protein
MTVLAILFFSSYLPTDYIRFEDEKNVFRMLLDLLMIERIIFLILYLGLLFLLYKKL